jgi:diacylglycerol O-acyltransferase
MSLAGDSASAPMQAGAVLMLSPRRRIDVSQLLTSLEDRLPSVPRLRRRLMGAPFGGGRPVWVDDATFQFRDHISVIAYSGPDLERAALDEAAQLMTTRLDRHRPLWVARLLVADGVEPGGGALVLVFHHVLADGIAGLSILAALTDQSEPVEDPAFPRQAATSRELRDDALAERLRGLRDLPRSVVRLVRGLLVLKPALRGRAARTSLNRPTGSRRRFETVHCELAAVRTAGAASGATINDVLLTAVAGAVGALLRGRGEHVEELVVSVPFSSRQTGRAGQLGNQSGVVPFDVPTSGPLDQRLAVVRQATARAKQGGRGSSAAILGPVFRVLAGTRLYRSFIDHQRIVHTIVTNVRGPDHELRLGGSPITRLIPLSVATGNITVAFAALSYAGQFTITLVADADAVPDLHTLRQALLQQLSATVLDAVS